MTSAPPAIRFAHTRVSSPCSNSGSTVASARLAPRGLVRHRFAPQIDTQTAALPPNRTAPLPRPDPTVEPLLQKVEAQHALHTQGLAPIACLRVVGLDQPHSLSHGATCSIASRNNGRRVFLLYRSNPFIIAGVLCLICLPMYLDSRWKRRA